MFLNNVDRVPSNVQFSPQEALLYVCEDNEAVFKMIIKGRSPTMRRVSRTQRVALDCFFEWINLVPNIQIKYIGQSRPTCRHAYQGNFTCDECKTSFVLCLTLAISVLQFFSEVMWKRRRKTIVTANSRPMMSLFQGFSQICHLLHQKALRREVMKVRVLGLRKLRNMTERGHPLFYLGEGHTSSNHVSLMRRPSTLLWKTKKLMKKTGTPVVCPQRGARLQQLIIGDDERELELSLGSRLFMHRVNDPVRQRQKNDLRWKSHKTTKIILWYGERPCL